MGLDMYLRRKICVGANYEHRKVTGRIEIKAAGVKVPITFKKVSEITEQACYWRKSNQIHQWFVDNVQEGVDDCGNYAVSCEQLRTLRELCQRALDTQDGSLLPPQGGFFFGSTVIDQYYWEDLKDTIEQLDKLDLDSKDYNVSYEYHSSW